MKQRLRVARYTVVAGACVLGAVFFSSFKSIGESDQVGSTEPDQVSQAPFRFGFAAHFTCGFDPDGAFSRIVPGQYATTINIHNPHSSSVTIRRRIALTFPDQNGGSAQSPGAVSGFLEDSLAPGEALQVDCGEIPSEFHAMDVPLRGQYNA